jgi:demethylspheroidene O-methyltransferase
MNLRRRFVALRNRLLASEAFQDFAARFPLTRPVALARARAAFDLTAGFVYSQVLLACVELGLLPLLADGAMTSDALAARIGMPPEGTERLVRAASSLGILEDLGGGLIALGPHGAALLGNPSVFAMIRHHRLFYRDLADPVALLRARSDETALAAYWRYARAEEPGAAGEGDVAPYSDLMAETQGFIARDVLGSVSLRRTRRLMDVGGGAGVFLAAAGQRYPHLELVLCDLPAVARRAETRLAKAGLSARARVVGCDFLKDSLPEGADAITLVRVLHDHDDDRALILLRAIRRALCDGGRLIIAEPMADTPGAAPSGAAYFGLYLWAMGGGRPRNPSEIAAMAREAGFVRCNTAPTPRPILCRVLVAS